MNNRQAGRRRGRGGQRPGGSPGRPDNGNRIDNRSRGNAAQLLEKYKNLAADSQRSGDRVNTEYYLQFADHYFRVLSETRSRYEETRRGQDDGNDDDGGDDYGYEGDVGNQSDDYREPQREMRDNRDNRQPRDNQRDGQRENRDRDDNRGNESRGNDNRERSDNRGDRQVNGGERQERAPRRERQPREDRPAREDRQPREERPRVIANDSDGEAPEARETRPAPVSDGATAEPRRRGRPRREAVPEADGGFDVAVLPPAIGIDSTPTAPVADDGEEARPRRRRRVARADEDATPPVA